MEKQEELRALAQEMGFISSIVNNVEAKAEWERDMPSATSRMLDQIILRHGLDVTILSFSFDGSSGVVRVSASCADANISSDYVDALYNSGVASSVNYQGYGSGGEGAFTFSVEITLNAEGAH
jgi:hypothetical protein